MNAHTPRTKRVPPLVTAVAMGYGHLRAAQALADAAGTELIQGDDPQVVGAREARQWARTRRGYETITRLSQAPRLGGLFRGVVDRMTEIGPPRPDADQSAPELGGRILSELIDRGLGRAPARMAQEAGRPLLTTFYAQAIAAERHGAEQVACVATDADIHRVWAPVDARSTRIVYLAPSQRVVQRLAAYGVPPSQIHFTGFPLPPELLGQGDLGSLKRNLARRLVRLDPRGVARRRLGAAVTEALGPLPEPEPERPVHLVVAIGGAGAQTATGLALLQGLAGPLRRGELRLTVVAGVRQEVARVFRMTIAALGLPQAPAPAADVLVEDDFATYYRRFNALLAEADVLWTKPSEMVFYAALGLPLLLAPPVGRHEAYNRRWVVDRGAALIQRSPGRAADWMREWLDEGVLADAAWAGHRSLPAEGTWRILETLEAVFG